MRRSCRSLPTAHALQRFEGLYFSGSREHEIILPQPDASIRHLPFLESHFRPFPWVGHLDDVADQRRFGGERGIGPEEG